MKSAQQAVLPTVPSPEWVATVNREGALLGDLSALVPLDESSLIYQACKATGLSDFGEDYWREALAVLCQSLESEGQLTLLGRILARHDVVSWLSSRLQVVDTLKQHPEILQEKIEAPMFIVGLPRSGTSILFELLSQDPCVGVPQTWEGMMPCPPPEAASYTSDARIDQCHQIATQWSRIAPSFASMHEMGATIPAECGQLMVGTLISDQIDGLHQIPSYSAWRMAADYVPVYRYHKSVLQILQWKNSRQSWLLKAPAHLGRLAELLQVYPDARIVQTHRDPIKCMASATSLMGTLFSMRSDQPFDAAMWETILLGEATAKSLEQVIGQREQGLIPAENITDSRYQDLMDDPIACIERSYDFFGMTLGNMARERMQAYLEAKPKSKGGIHTYEVDAQKNKERHFFARYQALYNVPDEC